MNDELAIGIDLGTTFSCVAVLKDNKVEIIPNEIGENTTPSLVSFMNDKILVGEQALSQLIMNPKNTIYSVKRLMGKNYDDPQVKNDIESHFFNYDVVKSESGNRPIINIKDNNNNINQYFPEEISKLILEKLVKSARDYLKEEVRKAVITVPAYFNDTQRKATKLSAEKAGLEVLRIINEPTAASLAYGLQKKLPKKESMNQSLFNINSNNRSEYIHNYDDEDDEKLIIVFDLGGGTFDVTLLSIECEDGEAFDFNIISSQGDPHLGGDDFDKKICDYCLKQFCSKFDNVNENEIRNDTESMNRLKIASEKAKIQLSSKSETVIDIDEFYNNELLHVKLTREKFEEMCKEEFNRLLNPLNEVLEDSGKRESDIKEIVFVGGSTRIPKIKELLNNYFSEIKNINDTINPDETVAYGAAIQAGKLMKQGNYILNDIILMDITPFSLGISTKNYRDDAFLKGSLMSVVIPRGSKIPIQKTEEYQNSYDNQERVSIKVYEGENKYVNKNHLLGEFLLIDLPKKPKGEVKIEVTFEINVDGILTVTAVETSRGIKNSLKIINDKGLNKEEIINNIKNTNIPLLNEENKEIKNFKKEMGEYYKYFKNANNNKDRSKFIFNFAEILVDFIQTFELEGNDTLGNKYFLYIKTLFDAYRAFIKLNDILDDQKKELIINNSKKFLKILSTFKNINYINYTELLNFFLIDLTKEQKYKSYEEQKDIEDSRNYILFELVVYSIELIEEKAEIILSSNIKFSRYNSKYLFNNCIQISELFIKSDIELSKFLELKRRYNNVIEKCKTEIKKINTNSLVEIDKVKASGKLFEKNESMGREELLIILDNYRDALKNIEGLNDVISEAIIYANIVKIKFKILNSCDYENSRKIAEQSLQLAISSKQNFQQYKWGIEIVNISNELRKIFEDKERYEQEEFEKKYIDEHKDIFDEIEEYKKKSNIEFIKFILQKHPPKRSPLKKGKTADELWKENAKSFTEKLSGLYNPDNIQNNTDDEKLKFTIYHKIIKKINSILTEISPTLNLKD